MRSAVRQDVFLLNRQKSYLPLHRRPCLLRCFFIDSGEDFIEKMRNVS